MCVFVGGLKFIFFLGVQFASVAPCKAGNLLMIYDFPISWTCGPADVLFDAVLEAPC